MFIRWTSRISRRVYSSNGNSSTLTKVRYRPQGPLGDAVREVNSTTRSGFAPRRRRAVRRGLEPCYYWFDGVGETAARGGTRPRLELDRQEHLRRMRLPRDA